MTIVLEIKCIMGDWAIFITSVDLLALLEMILIFWIDWVSPIDNWIMLAKIWYGFEGYLEQNEPRDLVMATLDFIYMKW